MSAIRVPRWRPMSVIFYDQWSVLVLLERTERQNRKLRPRDRCSVKVRRYGFINVCSGVTRINITIARQYFSFFFLPSSRIKLYLCLSRDFYLTHLYTFVYNNIEFYDFAFCRKLREKINKHNIIRKQTNRDCIYSKQ